MFYIGIDISKYFHHCYIARADGSKVKDFSFDNNQIGFQTLFDELSPLGDPSKIKVGFESTGHYHLNLAAYLSNKGYTYVEINPYLTNLFSKALSLRKTKTDKVDAKVIASMVGSVDYQNLHTKFYHTNDLRELTRARQVYLGHRSKELVKLTNLLDRYFPEIKKFFNNRFSVGFFFILTKMKTRKRISNLTMKDYELYRAKTMGRSSYASFLKLKELAKSSVGIDSKVYEDLIQISIKHYHYLDLLIENLDEQIVNLYQQTNSKLHTIPGLGIIAAATIYAEIGNIKNFSNSNKLIAYSGLDVRIIQSGGSEHFGRIVKRGSPLLRSTVWLYAFRSIKFCPEFTTFYYKKKAEHKHHKVVLTHLSRKILRMIFHIEKFNAPYISQLSN